MWHRSYHLLNTKFYPNTKLHQLSKLHRLWFGWVLAVLAWLMLLMPMTSSLWVEKPKIGYNICIQLAPIINHINQSHQTHTHLHQTHTHQTHTHFSKKDNQTPHQHDCDICLSAMSFALPAGALSLSGHILQFNRQLGAFYRQLRLQFLFFLRPPSRASPYYS